MLLIHMQEVNQIDNTIEELHAQLHSLYEERAALTAGKAYNTRTKNTTDLASVNLDDIDLSLDDN